MQFWHIGQTKSSFKIHKMFSKDTTKVKTTNLQQADFDYTELFLKKSLQYWCSIDCTLRVSAVRPQKKKSTFISLLMTTKSCWHQWVGHIHHSWSTLLGLCPLSHYFSAWPAPWDNLFFFVLSNHYSPFVLLSG